MSTADRAPQDDDQSRLSCGSDSRATIINAVRTPLGFFVLVVLIVEALLGTKAIFTSGNSATLVIVGMLTVIVLLILIVAVMALFRPPALYGRSDENAELGATASSLGIADLVPNWRTLLTFDGRIGQRLRKRLDKDKDTTSPVTWYIVTLSPEGFQSWLDPLREAVKRGVNVKWVYQAPASLTNDAGIKALWEMNVREASNAENFTQGLRTYIANLHHCVTTTVNEMQAMDDYRRKRAGSWEVYESVVPHTYLGFLSVPGIHPTLQEHAPDGTYGFVYPYSFFTRDTITRYGLYLTRGPILDYYYWATVQLFEEGVKRKYLSLIQRGSVS